MAATKKKVAKKKVAKRPAKKRVQKKVAKKVAKKMGRPTKFTPAVATRICSQLAAGKSMRTVCKDPKLPSMQTVFNWLRDKPEFLEQYERAKEESADYLVDEMIEIADDGANDYYFDEIIAKLDPDTTVGELMKEEGYLALKALMAKARPENAQRSRLRLDARKWIASKLKPKRYGDKLELGSDPTKPVITKIQHEVI